jgi:hypothetical protein
MQIGDEVEWTSQAKGSSRTKRGMIVVIVPAGRNVRELVPAGMKVDAPGAPRATESYLVQVGRRLYWPRVSSLQRIRHTPLDAVLDAARAYRDECEAPALDTAMRGYYRARLFEAVERAEITDGPDHTEDRNEPPAPPRPTATPAQRGAAAPGLAPRSKPHAAARKSRIAQVNRS